MAVPGTAHGRARLVTAAPASSLAGSDGFGYAVGISKQNLPQIGGSAGCFGSTVRRVPIADLRRPLLPMRTLNYIQRGASRLIAGKRPTTTPGHCDSVCPSSGSVGMPK